MTIVRDPGSAVLEATIELHSRSGVGQLYSGDLRDNAPLELHLVNGSVPLDLTSPDPAGGRARLSMTFSPNLIPATALASLKVTAPRWTCVSSAGNFPAIVMTPDGTDTIEPGSRVIFTITFTSDQPPLALTPGAAAVKIGYSQVGTAPPRTLTAQVTINSKPVGGFTADCSRDTIFVTRAGQAEVANTIEFAIRMSETMPAPDAAAPPPVFQLSFKYGDGPGTLTTLARAKDAELTQVGGTLWKEPVPPKAGPDDAVWILSPGRGVLKAGADAAFRLSKVVSQIGASQTEFARQPIDMYLQYSGVPGMADGVLKVPLWKELAKPGILEFRADRRYVDGGERVNLSWTTFAVDSVALQYARYFQDSEHTVTRPGLREAALDLTANDYDVYPTLESVAHTLFAYTSDSRVAVDFREVTLTGYRPTFKSARALPVYDGEAAVVTWEAHHADGVTLVDSLTQTPVRVLQPTTTLASACGEDDSSIRVQSAAGFPAGAGFDVQVDQEIMQVTARLEDTLWAVDRNDLECARHTPDAPVRGAMASAHVRVQRGSARCMLRAWKQTDPQHTGIDVLPSVQEAPVDVLIRPRITAAVEPIVVPDGGGPVQISWTIDQPADVWIQPGQKLATPWTVRVDGPAVLTLTAGSGTGNTHVESTAQVSIGRYRVKTIPMPPAQQVCMGFSYDGRRLCVLSGRTVSLIDVATLTVSRQFAVPNSDADGNSVAPVAFGVRDRGPYAGPLFGVAIDWLGERRIWVIDTGRDQLVYAPNYLVAGEIRSALALTSDGVVLSRPGDIPQTPTPESIARQMQTLRKNTAYILSAVSNAVFVVAYEFPS